MPWSRGLTAATNSAALKTPRAPISVSCTPAFAAEPPVSCQTAWLSRLTMTSSPGRVRTRSATWLAIVPLGSQSAASLPSRAARCSWSRLVVGSSPYWSSPTGAAAIAARISGDGRVTVSERRSIGVVMVAWETPEPIAAREGMVLRLACRSMARAHTVLRHGRSSRRGRQLGAEDTNRQAPFTGEGVR